MKTLSFYFAAFFFMLISPLGAQNEVYKINYTRIDTKAEERVQDLPLADPDAVANMFRERPYVLYVTDTATLYKGTGDYAIYHNLKTDNWTKLVRLPEDVVLIKYDSVPSIKWKITGEENKVNGMRALKAVGLFKGKQVTAWFTPDIPLDAGPEFFHGLPGLIVYAKWGDFIYKVTGISRTDEKIRPPRSPVVMTEEEFKKKLNSFKSITNKNGSKLIILNR